MPKPINTSVTLYFAIDRNSPLDRRNLPYRQPSMYSIGRIRSSNMVQMTCSEIVMYDQLFNSYDRLVKLQKHRRTLCTLYTLNILHVPPPLRIQTHFTSNQVISICHQFHITVHLLHPPYTPPESTLSRSCSRFSHCSTLLCPFDLAKLAGVSPSISGPT